MKPEFVRAGSDKTFKGGIKEEIAKIVKNPNGRTSACCDIALVKVCLEFLYRVSSHEPQFCVYTTAKM